MNVLTTIQYRLLKRLFPAGENTAMDDAYAGKSKLQTLLGSALLAELRGMTVIDFGCRTGIEAIEMARYAKQVIGIDILEDKLAEARRQAASAGADNCIFTTKAEAKADIIISLDSFEHFDDPAHILEVMFDLLLKGGKVMISFGPTWFHPNGGHLFSVFPWAHLIFSEAALIRWRSDFRHDGATRFGEVEGGLNQITIRRFKQIVAQSRFHLRSLETVPIRRLAPIHCRLTEEFTTSIVRCTLVKH